MPRPKREARFVTIRPDPASGPGHWLAPSESTPGVVYHVQVARLPDGSLSAVCTCLGDAAHHHCKHAQEAITLTDQQATLEPGTAPETSEEPVSIDPDVQHGREMAIFEHEDQQGRSLAPIEVIDTRRRPSLLPMPDEVASMKEMSKIFALQGGLMLPNHIKSASAAFTIVYLGWELGIPAMAALTHAYVVNGKVQWSTQALMGIVRARDASARFWWEESEDAVTAYLERQGPRGPVVTKATFTLAMAQTAKLAEKDVWKTYRPDMLRWAAIRRVIRLGASDIALGLERSVNIPEEEPTDNPEPDERPQGSLNSAAVSEALVREMRARGVSRDQLVGVVGDDRIEHIVGWLRDHPDKGIAGLVAEAATKLVK